MTTEAEQIRALHQRLDDLAAELLARAVALDTLAADIERRLMLVAAREKAVTQRERDVLMASAEVVALRKQAQRGEVDYGRSAH